MYKTIIVEDEGPARRRLEKMVQEHPALDLLASLKSGQEAMDFIPKFEADLLLLDIQLKDKTAFDILQELENKINCRIIFVTAFDQYAIKAFEVEAIDYLLKPYNLERFNKAIDRIIKKDFYPLDLKILESLKDSLNKNDTKILIPEGNKKHMFQGESIIYVKSDKYHVYVHTLKNKRLIRITLKKLESILPKNFVRINKSTIVNTDCISQIDLQKNSSKISLNSGEEFFSSSTYNQALRSLLI